MTATISELEQELEALGKQHARVAQLAGQFSQEELTRLCYRHFAAAYDKHMEETGHYHALRWALERCKELIEPGTLLDVSCGTGEALLYLAEHLKEKEIDVIANDLSPEMLEIARQKLKNNNFQEVSFSGTNICTKLYPFTPYAHETVLCSYSLHSFPEPKEKIIKNLVVAVKNFGHLIVMEEWPCRITPSLYIPAAVQELLPLSEKPLEVVLGSSSMENALVRDGSFMQMEVRDANESLGSLIAKWPHMVEIAAGCKAIDKRHSLYLHVYEKLNNPGII